jgi:trehalose utilization protein
MNPRVLVFCEDHPQPQQERYEATYPAGIGETIAAPLRANGLDVRNAYSTQPENGLGEAALETTDVLIYWSHKGHRFVSDEVVARLHDRVLRGMGLIVLHSSMGAAIFHKLMGTTARLFWRNYGERERVWVVDPQHPIAEGLGPYIELEQEEMYSEPFSVPTPDELVFISWFEGGEVFRSGCCWRRGRGRIFYFRPGHETAPTYHNPDVQRVLYNAARWAAPVGGVAPTREHEGVTFAPEGPFTSKFEGWTPPTGPRASTTGR